MTPSDSHQGTGLKRRHILAATAAGAAAFLSLPAWAQAYPNKPIKWVVPYNAGGASDIVARVIGEALGNALGQRVLIDNRPGAGGTVGTAMLATSPADGYTLATADNGGLYNNWYLFDKLPYNQNSFEYVAMTGRFPLVLAVHRDVPVRDVKQWTQWVKQQGGKVSYGTPGVGSPHHLAMATLDDMLGLQMQHIPYKGDSAAVVDLVGGQIQTMFMGVATARQYLKDDRLRFLAVTWSGRLTSMPDVPTFEEAGIRNFEGSAEQGIIMPAGTPKDVVLRMNQEVGKVLRTPAVREKLETLGMYPVLKSPEEFRAYVAKQAQSAGEVIKRKGISIN
ncbi:MAG: tripartite tricarboxylate transporter substrate binding protein [Pseudomonadota bacterium]